MKWSAREVEARQGAMFDVMLGEIVERGLPRPLDAERAPDSEVKGPAAFSSQPRLGGRDQEGDYQDAG